MAAPKKTVGMEAANRSVSVEAEPATESDGTFPEAPLAYERGHQGPQVYAAMIRAQAEIGNIRKDAKNPHFKNNFVSLEAASNAIIPILNKNGLGVKQEVKLTLDGTPVLNTVIYHEDGSELGQNQYPIVSKDRDDPQKIAASVTYARRYSLMAIVGAAPEDDDGTLAATPPPPKVTQKETLKKHLLAIKADAARAKQIIDAAGVEAENFAALTEEQATKIMKMVNSNVPF